VRAFLGGAAKGDIEYRFGYNVIPHPDLMVLLNRARTDGTILPT
jgi:hypothetical protein